MATPIPTRTRLLDLAQELAQTRGLNAFSFKDLARGVGISTASVHHHFPSKADLGRELMARYREHFRDALADIDDRSHSPRRKLEAFAQLFLQTLRQGNRLCLCGVLATEYLTLPESVQQEVRGFYDETEHWLEGVLEQGRADQVFRLAAGDAGRIAKTFLATLEGATISARTFGDEKRFARATSWFLASIEADARAPRNQGRRTRQVRKGTARR